MNFVNTVLKNMREYETTPSQAAILTLVNNKNKRVQRWIARINDTITPWTEKEIIYFRKAIGTSGIEDSEVRKYLIKLFIKNSENVGGYRITSEQDVKGVKYLLRQSLKKNGQPRKQCKLSPGEIDILNNLTHHRFIGLYNAGPALSDYYLPIYRAISSDDQFFEYVGATYSMIKVVG